MSYKLSIRWHNEQIAILGFQDAPRQNQLCWAAVDELGRMLTQAREAGARVLILASDLPGHWLEHAWLRDLDSLLAGDEATGSGIGWFDAQQELAGKAMISIAAVTGDCSGGGAELGWACDFRIAERQARFAQPEINMQLSTGIGGCSRLLRLIGRGPATEMVLTGRPVTAERLYQLGGLTEVVETGAALDAAIGLAESLLENSWAALLSMKATLASSADLPLATALEQEQHSFQALLSEPAAAAGIKATQARFDQGESIAEVYKYDINK